jgi:glycosyltransferase involved in cell wall biosynthesis
MQFHVLSFEGPDAYARAGGLASRVDGLTESLATLGFETHLWYVGDPDRPGHERHDELHYHRWGQWISRHHTGGVYDGEEGKRADFARSLPPHLLSEHLARHLREGGRAVVMAEEWHTVDAVLHLDFLLRARGLRERVEILWNANNTYGFERIPWVRLREASRITTVSRYMKQRMWAQGVDPLVVPNGLPPDAFEDPDPAAVRALRARLSDRTVLAKMARWSPDKRWMTAIGTVADLKRRGWRPLLVARGGSEAYGGEVRARAHELGLRWEDRSFVAGGEAGLLEALTGVEDADVVNLCAHVGPVPRRLLFRGAHAVLANSAHEPFGLVGLEAMAVGGLACTGSSGEDYVLPGQNAVMLETDDPSEFPQLYGALRSNPRAERAMRRAGRWTAKRFAWPEVLQGVFLPRLNGGVSS